MSANYSDESDHYLDIEIGDDNITYSDEDFERLLRECDASWPERVNYYMAYPSYFLEKLYESVTTLSWQL
jgi:hypothetical protein